MPQKNKDFLNVWRRLNNDDILGHHPTEWGEGSRMRNTEHNMH